ncbi:MAG: IS21-like element ISFK1 family helper ATPase IstB [Aquirhabdus sp.]
MLNTITKDKLTTLGLKGMARVLDLHIHQPEIQKLSFEERFGLLLDAECNDRDQRRFERFLMAARLRYTGATLEDIDYHAERQLERRLITNLVDCEWIKRRQNLIITGATGTGKSWIGCAFGVQACRLGYSTYYTSSNQLFEDLSLALADGTLPRLRRKLIKVELLIIDDFGLGGIDPALGPSLLEIIDQQSKHGALLLTSQFPTAQWHTMFADPTIADAILDRIVHRAHILELAGESMRKRKGKNI